MAAPTSNVVSGRWIVTLRPYTTPRMMTAHKSLISTKTADPTPFSCKIHEEFDFPELRGYAASFDEATKAEMEEMHEVTAIEPVKLCRHCAVQPNAPWGLSRITARSKLPAHGPYSYTYRDEAAGEGVVAYVVDTGINIAHVEFEGRATRGEKFVTEPLPGTVTSDDDVQGHGTHCAGTIASRAYGVAKKADVVGVKVFNDFDEKNHPELAGAMTSDIVAALQWVIAQVNEHGKPSVVNMSLGGSASPALDAAVAAAVRSGIVVCVAAGNDSNLAEGGSPAREPLAVTVGATTIADALPFWSSYGKVVDILAPGLDIESCWIGSPTAKNTISGTSMATPHVVGVACCLLSDASWAEKDPSQVMPQMLIQADKNKISGLTGTKARTVNALLQLADS